MIIQEVKQQGTLKNRLRCTIVSLLAILSVTSCSVMQPQYDDPLPIKSSADNYGGKFYDGQFHNQVEVPVVMNTEGKLTALYQFLFQEDKGAVPDRALPSHKSDLFQLKSDEDVVVWMGHSSYFIQVDGVKLLIDPVFSDNASPVPATNVAFKGSNIYTAEDIPEIDYLLISHDHWDHLDYPTIDSLRDKIKHIVTPVGVGSYFTQWDFSEEMISEGDWYHTAVNNNQIQIDILPTQHFSGRFFTRNQTLWGSFAVITKNHQLYLGGDSGYGPHFKEIGERYGSFDVAVLECGQYDKNWPYIHMTPE